MKELRGDSDPRINAEVMEQEEPITPIVSTHQNEEVAAITNQLPQPLPIQKITKSHIKKFVHAHKIQVEAVETYLRGSTELVNEFERDYEELSNYKSAVADETLVEKYIDYKTELDYKGNRVTYFLDILKNKIKGELADEEEEM